MAKHPDEITRLVLKAAEEARNQEDAAHEPALTQPIEWPVQCTVGPGLEGAIACESKVGYVNGSKGRLIYRGYDIFDLCAYSNFEEVCYLLLHGELPTAPLLDVFSKKLVNYRRLPETLRRLMSFPVERMKPMAALRLGVNLMRQEFTSRDLETGGIDVGSTIGSDEDSIPMETLPRGAKRATYEFRAGKPRRQDRTGKALQDAAGLEACCHLIAGVATLAAAISRVHKGYMPIDPDPHLSHAANFLYMITGARPDPAKERVMDISLILHADHGMNASMFAAMVVASTLADIYFSVGAGISALSGPLHGGANEQVMLTLEEIGSPKAVKAWYKKARARNRKIMGFGHRVYKTYDPRARVLGPLAKHVAKGAALVQIAESLEREVVEDLGAKKQIYPNVDFYSGVVYGAMGISPELFTPTFAVSRVSGWTARVLEYLENNRIFRPRAVYVGPLDREYIPVDRRVTRTSSGRRIR